MNNIPQNQQLINYINEACEAGMSIDEIKDNLLKVGWNQDDFREYFKNRVEQKNQFLKIWKNNKIIFPIAIFLIVAGIGMAARIMMKSDLEKTDMPQINKVVDGYKKYRNEMFGIEINYPENLKIDETDYYKDRKIISLELDFYDFNFDPNGDDAVIDFDINALNDATETIQGLEQELRESSDYGTYKIVDIYIGDIKIEGVKAESADEDDVNIMWIKDGLFYDAWSVNESVMEKFISGIKLTQVKFSQSDFEQNKKLDLAENRDAIRISDMRQIELALDIYYDTNLSYPETLKELTPNFIRSLPRDPLVGDYYYVPKKSSNGIIDSYELGAAFEASRQGDNEWSVFINQECEELDSADMHRFCYKMILNNNEPPN